MIDASKFPKAARLQQQREEKYEAEQTRLKAERLRDEAKASISIRQRNKAQQNECKAAEAKVAKRRQKK